jgi:hypothetical protein
VKWVTREHPKTDRIACPWLIRRFIDPDAEIVYVGGDDVLGFAEREGAISFDAPGARFTHRDGLCSFEVLVESYALGGDAALALVARVVHGADVAEDRDATPQSPGLLAIADGFSYLGLPDVRQLELELPVYDALYAWAQRQVAPGADRPPAPGEALQVPASTDAPEGRTLRDPWRSAIRARRSDVALHVDVVASRDRFSAAFRKRDAILGLSSARSAGTPDPEAPPR